VLIGLLGLVYDGGSSVIRIVRPAVYRSNRQGGSTCAYSLA